MTIADKEVRAEAVRSLLDRDMRSTSVRRRAVSAVVIAGLVTLAAWAAHDIVANAAYPSGLYWYHHREEPYVYPVADVRWWLSVIAVELITASWFLWRARRPAVTASVLAFVFLLACFPSAVIIVDAPRYVGDHLSFVARAMVWLLLAAVALWIAHLVRYLCNRRQLRMQWARAQ
jgi:hypothetical protein